MIRNLLADIDRCDYWPHALVGPSEARSLWVCSINSITGFRDRARRTSSLMNKMWVFSSCSELNVKRAHYVHSQFLKYCTVFTPIFCKRFNTSFEMVVCLSGKHWNWNLLVKRRNMIVGQLLQEDLINDFKPVEF